VRSIASIPRTFPGLVQIGDECLAERGTLPTCPILLPVWRQPRPAATRMLRGDSPEAKGSWQSLFF
jgi:hypothetical protein